LAANLASGSILSRMHRFCGPGEAHILDTFESASPIMPGLWDEWRNLTLTDGSNPDF
jgi:hypothetical protein